MCGIRRGVRPRSGGVRERGRSETSAERPGRLTKWRLASERKHGAGRVRWLWRRGRGAELASARVCIVACVREETAAAAAAGGWSGIELDLDGAVKRHILGRKS